VGSFLLYSMPYMVSWFLSTGWEAVATPYLSTSRQTEIHFSREFIQTDRTIVQQKGLTEYRETPSQSSSQILC